MPDRMSRILCLALLLLSCSRETGETCGEPVACTLEIRTLTVSVSDASGVAIPLDSFTVFDLTRDRDITPSYSPEDLDAFRTANAYPLLSDVTAEGYGGKQNVLRFTGFREGNPIARREFLAGADCCHVQLYDGDTEIVLD